MQRCESEEQHGPAADGRKMPPRACVITQKPHVRAFLCEALEGLGLTACGCAEPEALGLMLRVQAPELVMIGLSIEEPSPRRTFHRLVEDGFKGKVLLMGPPGLAVLSAAQLRGTEMGLSLLPVLHTPYRDEELRQRLSFLVPSGARRRRPVGVAEPG
jgi:hypothetical protein